MPGSGNESKQCFSHHIASFFLPTGPTELSWSTPIAVEAGIRLKNRLFCPSFQTGSVAGFRTAGGCCPWVIPLGSWFLCA